MTESKPEDPPKEVKKKKDRAIAHGAPRDPTMKARIWPPGHFLGSCLATVILGTFANANNDKDKDMRLHSPRSPFISLLGVASLGVSVKLFRTAIATFCDHQTPVPHGYKVKTVVSQGVFGYSRNPIYVAMVSGVASVGLVMNTWWGVVAATYLASALQCLVIPYEEAYLEKSFGQSYLDYKAKVPRWLLF